MLGKIFGAICVASVSFALINSGADDIGNAVIDGASSAVSLTISLCGMMCLWCGIMRVLERAGMIERLARLLSPLLRFFFPDAYRKGVGCSEIAASISANLLGIGNAATPLAICAMKKLQENNLTPSIASHDMITLAVLNHQYMENGGWCSKTPNFPKGFSKAILKTNWGAVEGALHTGFVIRSCTIL